MTVAGIGVAVAVISEVGVVVAVLMICNAAIGEISGFSEVIGTGASPGAQPARETNTLLATICER